MGNELERDPNRGKFVHFSLKGVCELCPVDDPEEWGQSVSTNYYIRGVKVTDGDSVQSESDPKNKVYVPCCDNCRDVHMLLPTGYQRRFPAKSVV